MADLLAGRALHRNSTTLRKESSHETSSPQYHRPRGPHPRRWLCIRRQFHHWPLRCRHQPERNSDSFSPRHLKRGNTLTGTLYNGDDKETTTDASVENGAITLNFEHYLTKIVATPRDGKLEGKVLGRFERDTYISAVPFVAAPHVEPAAVQGSVPNIGGVWEIEYDSAKGEKAWRLIVKQNGPDASASILRIDGDTGALDGSYRGGKFVLSHFDGSRPRVAEVAPQPDGMLQLQLKGAYTPDNKLTAYRPEAARAKGLPEPDDFVKHTTVRDPNEVFTLKFPDANGKLVSNDDPQFKGKVVLAIVTGTWCPNCHDEAQYLVQLYNWSVLSSLCLMRRSPRRSCWIARRCCAPCSGGE